MGFMELFGYSWIRKKGETSPFFRFVSNGIRFLTYLMILGVVIIIIGAALKKH